MNFLLYQFLKSDKLWRGRDNLELQIDMTGHRLDRTNHSSVPLLNLHDTQHMFFQSTVLPDIAYSLRRNAQQSNTEDAYYVYTTVPGEKICFYGVLVSAVVARTLVDECYRPLFLYSVNEIASRTLVEQCNAIVLVTAAKALGSTGEVVDYAKLNIEFLFDICKAIAVIDKNTDWNRYVVAAYPEGNTIQVVIIYQYYKNQLYNNLSVPGTSLVSFSIHKIEYNEYKPWNVENFNGVWHPPVDTGGCNGT